MSSARTFPTEARRIYTVGHSTRPFEELLEQLSGVELLVDVRSVPRSRRNPQFECDALARSLAESGVEYAHARALGGFRKPSADSPNGGWEHPAFRGYADYMATPEFAAALSDLQARASERVACSCARRRNGGAATGG